MTEAICGVDLVEFQLRQAAGLPLPLTQEQITPRGHAIEVRLNAEQPDQGFLPGTGTLIDVVAPVGLRFDSGVAMGSDVGTSYDSMLAKLIAHGPDRDTARRKLVKGLRQLAMPGVPLNQGFLVDCLDAPVFAEGRATTGFLAETFPDGWKPNPENLLALRGWAAVALIGRGADNPMARTDGFRTMRARKAIAPMHVDDNYGDAELELQLGANPTVTSAAGDSLALAADTRPKIWPRGKRVYAAGEGLTIALTARPLAEARLSMRANAQSEGQIVAPLTGLVTKVHVAVGDEVKAGALLVEMEAMKLVHTLTAPFDGHITRVACEAGDTLVAKTLLIEMEQD